MIVDLQKSPRKFKRFRVVLDNGETYDFGYSLGKTYIDHGDKRKRAQYWARHYTGTEKNLIDNLIPSPALFSAVLLWSRYTNIYANIGYLNELWARKHRDEKNLV